MPVGITIMSSVPLCIATLICVWPVMAYRSTLPPESPMVAIVILSALVTLPIFIAYNAAFLLLHT